MRYYDKTKRNEVFRPNQNTLTSDEIGWWFEPLPSGYKMTYAEDGTPYKYDGNFVKPIVSGGEVVEGEDYSILLENAKKEKRKEIKKNKKEYQSQGVVSKINGVDYTFFGGIESARKYKDAMDLAISLGLEEGTIRTVEGMVSIGKDDMNTALQAVALQAYKGWLKESYINEEIESKDTIESVNYVAWEVIPAQPE